MFAPLSFHARLRALAVLLACSLLGPAGCTHVPTPQQRLSNANGLASAHGWQSMRIVGRLDVMAWQAPRMQRGEPLTVYVEGDGLAWLSRSQASSDPTPITPVALQLALAQPQGNAAYLGRPCQYLSDARCEPRYWTQQRFAPEVIDSLDHALDVLLHQSGATSLVLVGYSGGAAVTALLAERRHDVQAWLTVAGNIDHIAWARYQRITPLTGSLDPLTEAAALQPLPQWHFIGRDDRIVPPLLVEQFAAHMPKASVQVLEGYDHQCCWAAAWPALYQAVQAERRNH